MEDFLDIIQAFKIMRTLIGARSQIVTGRQTASPIIGNDVEIQKWTTC